MRRTWLRTLRLLAAAPRALQHDAHDGASPAHLTKNDRGARSRTAQWRLSPRRNQFVLPLAGVNEDAAESPFLTVKSRQDGTCKAGTVDWRSRHSAGRAPWPRRTVEGTRRLTLHRDAVHLRDREAHGARLVMLPLNTYSGGNACRRSPGDSAIMEAHHIASLCSVKHIDLTSRSAERTAACSCNAVFRVARGFLKTCLHWNCRSSAVIRQPCHVVLNQPILIIGAQPDLGHVRLSSRRVRGADAVGEHERRATRLASAPDRSNAHGRLLDGNIQLARHNNSRTSVKYPVRTAWSCSHYGWIH